MKAIVMGPPLVGKSTLVRCIRNAHSEINILDYDEEILLLNDGIWPPHHSSLMSTLQNKVLERVLKTDEILFMSFELATEKTKLAKECGFKVIHLVAKRDELVRRNQERLKTEPNNDAFQFVDANLRQQHQLIALGLVDHELDATQTTESLVSEIITLAT